MGSTWEIRWSNTGETSGDQKVSTYRLVARRSRVTFQGAKRRRDDECLSEACI